MQTYTVKSNAARAAAKAGLNRSDVAQDEHGNWYVDLPDFADVDVSEADDFAPPAFLNSDKSTKDAADLPEVDLSVSAAEANPGMVSDAEAATADPARTAYRDHEAPEQPLVRMKRELTESLADSAPTAAYTTTRVSLRNVAAAFLAWFDEYVGKDAVAEISHPAVDAMRAALANTPAKAQRKPRTAKSTRTGTTKREEIVALLCSPEGCTRADILDLTGWPSVTVQGLAAASNLDLRQVKEGRVFRYFGTPKSAD